MSTKRQELKTLRLYKWPCLSFVREDICRFQLHGFTLYHVCTIERICIRHSHSHSGYCQQLAPWGHLLLLSLVYRLPFPHQSFLCCCLLWSCTSASSHQVPKQQLLPLLAASQQLWPFLCPERHRLLCLFPKQPFSTQRQFFQHLLPFGCSSPFFNACTRNIEDSS